MTTRSPEVQFEAPIGIGGEETQSTICMQRAGQLADLIRDDSQLAGIQRVILFGSVARGEARPHDIDILWTLREKDGEITCASYVAYQEGIETHARVLGMQALSKIREERHRQLFHDPAGGLKLDLWWMSEFELEHPERYRADAGLIERLRREGIVLLDRRQRT